MNIKYQTIHIIVLFCLFCATVSAESNIEVLYDKYRQYSTEAENANTILPLISYHSKKLLGDMEFYFKYKDLNKSIDTLFGRLKFPLDLKITKSSSQKVEQSNGCLLVNGVSNKNEKLSILIGYVFEYNDWKINSIKYLYLDNNQSYPKKIKCDSK